MSLLTHSQVLSMLTMQDEMNCIVNPAWRTAGYNWPRAILVEAVEAIKYNGWRWREPQQPDMPQLQMELVEIWRLALSLLMQSTTAGNERHLHDVATNIETWIADAAQNSDIPVVHNGMRYANDTNTLLDDFQLMAGIAASGGFSVRTFHRCLVKSGMSWDELYARYIGKNVLNRFRQEQCYKTGRYIKDWSALPIAHAPAGKVLEDDDHLNDLLELIGYDADNLRDELMDGLRARYMAVLKARRERFTPETPGVLEMEFGVLLSLGAILFSPNAILSSPVTFVYFFVAAFVFISVGSGKLAFGFVKRRRSLRKTCATS